MSEDFTPAPWDPDKIKADTIDLSKLTVGTVDLSKIAVETVDLADLVRDPTSPWLFTTRQDLESRRRTTTASSTDSASPALAPRSPNDRPGSRPIPQSHTRKSSAFRRLWDLLTRAVGNSGY